MIGDRLDDKAARRAFRRARFFDRWVHFLQLDCTAMQY
jgi:hypothetical protein